MVACTAEIVTVRHGEFPGQLQEAGNRSVVVAMVPTRITFAFAPTMITFPPFTPVDLLGSSDVAMIPESVVLAVMFHCIVVAAGEVDAIEHTTGLEDVEGQ